jgi:hypothetical protein
MSLKLMILKFWKGPFIYFYNESISIKPLLIHNLYTMRKNVDIEKKTKKKNVDMHLC